MGPYQFHSVFLYIATCIHGCLVSVLPILCATGSVVCIAMPCLNIGTKRRVYVTGPAKPGYIYTNYTCSENSTVLFLVCAYDIYVLQTSWVVVLICQ